MRARATALSRRHPRRPARRSPPRKTFTWRRLCPCVAGLAVKCLPPLVRKVHDAQVDAIITELCKFVLEGKEEQRDICAIALKTVVVEMPSSMGGAAARQLVRSRPFRHCSRRHGGRQTVRPHAQSAGARTAVARVAPAATDRLGARRPSAERATAPPRHRRCLGSSLACSRTSSR